MLRHLKLGEPELVLVVLAIGDIGRRSDESGELAFLVDIRLTCVEYITILAIRPAQAIFHIEMLMVGECFVEDMHASREIVGMQGLDPGVAADLAWLFFAPDEAFPLGVCEDDLAFGIGQPEHDGRIFGDDAEIRFL